MTPRNAFHIVAPSSFPSGVGMLRPDYLLSPSVIELFDIGLVETTETDPAFTASLRTEAAYTQLQSEVADGLELSAGVRYERGEQAMQPLQVFNVLTNSGASTNIENDYVLPSATVTYKFKDNMQVRFNASKTIARPQFRELMYQLYFDPEANRAYRGNPLLTDSEFVFNDASKVFWQLKDVNARGQSTREQLGADAFAGRTQVVTSYDPATGLMSARQSGTQGSDNNRQNLAYLWDANGNLERRTDHNQSGLYESFVYDELNRLDSSTRNGTTNLDMTYSAIGNVTRKSDVGATDYLYMGNQAGCTYYTHSQPHAVRKVGAATYCYDANGNMTNRNGTTIAWNSRNLPTSIAAPGGISSQFSYGPSGNRCKQTATYSGGSETTVYIGGLMEKVTSGTTTYYRHYIAAGSSSVVYVRTSAGATETYHITGDHLGSFSSVTNSAGALVVSESFDAFGKRRGANWTGAPTTAEMQAIANSTRNGFTGHEHLDNLGLIHMNGRVQDPTLGRFISADPFLTQPGNSQNLNRYSYVYNNPLSFTDPSGFDVCTSFDNCVETAPSQPNEGFRRMTYDEATRFIDSLMQHRGEGSPNAADGKRGDYFFPNLFYTLSTGGSEPSSFGSGTAAPQVFSSSSAEAGSLFYSRSGGGHSFGLQMSRTTQAGTRYFIDEEPAELAELRRKHPGWRLLEEEMWARSVPSSFGLFLQKLPAFALKGGAREHGFFVFQSLSDPNKLQFQLIVAREEANKITGTFRIPEGYRFLAMFHTHPFVFGRAGARGPSDGLEGWDDIDMARAYPEAFYYIRALGHYSAAYPGEWYYYGPRLGIP